MSAMLAKDDILRGLHKIDIKAKEASIVVDLSIYGGAAMALVFDTRRTTRDVDAVVHGALISCARWPEPLRKKKDGRLTG